VPGATSVTTVWRFRAGDGQFTFLGFYRIKRFTAAFAGGVVAEKGTLIILEAPQVQDSLRIFGSAGEQADGGLPRVKPKCMKKFSAGKVK